MPLEQNKAIALEMYRAFDLQDIKQGQNLMAANIVGQAMDEILCQGRQFYRILREIFALDHICHLLGVTGNTSIEARFIVLSIKNFF